MKKIIFGAIIILGNYFFADAQSSTGASSKNTTSMSSTSKKSKQIKKRHVAMADTGIYHRRGYKSNKTGQSATVTG